MSNQGKYLFGYFRRFDRFPNRKKLVGRVLE